MSIGKINSPWIAQGLNIFESRIKKYVNFSPIVIPDIKNAKSLSMESIKEEEGKLILSNLSQSDLVVIMDEKGSEFTSRQFADWMQKQMNSGRKRMMFIIGGPFGFSKSVYYRSDFKIALSKMTLTHEMAKLVLTEQIYRSLTILRGEPYHHD